MIVIGPPFRGLGGNLHQNGYRKHDGTDDKQIRQQMRHRMIDLEKDKLLNRAAKPEQRHPDEEKMPE